MAITSPNSGAESDRRDEQRGGEREIKVKEKRSGDKRAEEKRRLERKRRRRGSGGEMQRVAVGEDEEECGLERGGTGQPG